MPLAVKGACTAQFLRIKRAQQQQQQQLLVSILFMLSNRAACKQTVVALSKAMWNSKTKAQGAAVDQLGFVLEFDPSESRMVVMIFLCGRASSTASAAFGP